MPNDNKQGEGEMMRVLGRSLGAAVAALALLGPATAQPPPAFHFTAISRPADAPPEYPLYPGVAPGSEGARQVELWERIETVGSDRSDVVVRNVVRPTYSVFLPDPAKATGAAVILAPGGGFQMLAMTTEGWQAARWLADHGVAAFVLKYRTDETPADPAAFVAATAKIFTAKVDADHPPPVGDPFAVPDGQAMVRLLRRDAARFKIDPHRIGFVGFSAGAMTALGVTLADEPASRPDFVGLIYPPMNRVSVPADAPQAFMALASNDGLFGHSGFGLVESWRKAERPIEFHYYEAGDHGFGMRRLGTTSDHWIDEFYWWLEARGVLKPAA
jgi:acetyl esterase/lipase